MSDPSHGHPHPGDGASPYRDDAPPPPSWVAPGQDEAPSAASQYPDPTGDAPLPPLGSTAVYRPAPAEPTPFPQPPGLPPRSDDARPGESVADPFLGDRPSTDDAQRGVFPGGSSSGVEGSERPTDPYATASPTAHTHPGASTYGQPPFHGTTQTPSTSPYGGEGYAWPAATSADHGAPHDDSVTQPGATPWAPYPTSAYGAPAASGPYGPPSGAGPFGAPGYGAPVTTPAASGQALAALIVGIVSVVLPIPFLGVLIGGAAVFLGIIALRRARAGTGGGKGMAITGIVTGILGILLALATSMFLVAAMRAFDGYNPRSSGTPDRCATLPVGERASCRGMTTTSPAPSTAPADSTPGPSDTSGGDDWAGQDLNGVPGTSWNDLDACYKMPAGAERTTCTQAWQAKREKATSSTRGA